MHPVLCGISSRWNGFQVGVLDSISRLCATLWQTFRQIKLIVDIDSDSRYKNLLLPPDMGCHPAMWNDVSS